MLLQRESFPTMFNTINSSPMLLTKSVFKWIFVLSNYQTCTFPLQSTLYLRNAILFEQVWKKKIHYLFSYFYPNVFDSLMFVSGFKVLYRIGKKTKYNSYQNHFVQNISLWNEVTFKKLHLKIAAEFNCSDKMCLRA